MLTHRRATNREREAAKLLGTRRVYRSQYESAPDIEPVHLSCGLTLSVEVKTRAKLPALLMKGLAQATRYEPSAVPAVVISALGGEALIVLPLRAFRSIAGITPEQP